MNFYRYKILGLQLLLLNQLFLVELYKPKQTLATENTNQPSPEYIRKIPDNKFYILGAGDTLSLKVKGEDTPALNRKFSINGEGIANLARLKRIYASGLTLAELTDILNKEYSKYVKEPNVELLMVNYRPVKIYIDGEIITPGLHVLPGSASPLESIENFESTETDKGINSANSLSTSNQSSSLQNNIFFPSIIDAIRKSGGITMFADLTQIKITRVNTITKGSGRVGTEVNLIKTLDLRDSSQNLRLLDGDTIFISKSEKPLLSQISKALKSNLNPKFIDVYIGGRVEQPGALKVNKSAILTEALEISGGTKVLKGPVTFLRYRNDGTVDRRKFQLRNSAPRGSYQNPYLRSGDVIYVGKSLLNITTEVVTEITAPLQSLFTTYAFIKLVNDE